MNFIEFENTSINLDNVSFIDWTYRDKELICSAVYFVDNNWHFNLDKKDTLKLKNYLNNK